MHPLIDYLNRILHLPEMLREQLLTTLKAGRLAKKEMLVKAGVISRNIYFIQSGLLRHFQLGHEEQITMWFIKETDIAFSALSIYSQLPSNEYIQAITPTEYYFMSIDEVRQIFGQYPDIYLDLVWALIGHYQVLRDRHRYMLGMRSVDHRYKYMCENYSDIVSRVPDKLMASYLVCSAETLSRVKAQLQQNGSIAR